MFPAPGKIVANLQGALNIIKGVDRDARSNTPHAGGDLSHEAGSSGSHVNLPPQSSIQCFEITGCWRRHKPKSAAGPTLGLNWVTNAKRVGFFYRGTDDSSSGNSSTASSSSESTSESGCHPILGTENENGCGSGSSSSGSSGSFEARLPDMLWKSADAQPGAAPYRIFWGIASPHDQNGWQNVLYPRYEIGQWVLCWEDIQAGVWRVLDDYDQFVRFRLVEPMNGCGRARAQIIGYNCGSCSSSSSSGPSSSSAESSSSDSSSSQQSSSRASSSNNSSTSNSSTSESRHCKKHKCKSSCGDITAAVCPTQDGTYVMAMKMCNGKGKPSWQKVSPGCDIGDSDSSASEESSGCPSSSKSRSGSDSCPCGDESGSHPSENSSASSSNPSSSSNLSSSSSNSSSSSSAATHSKCLHGAISRGNQWVYDELGIVNGQFKDGIAPSCSTGVAKRWADRRRWEVISPYGSCFEQPQGSEA